MRNAEISLAAAMAALASHQDLVAANLANVSSTAYKRKVAAYASFESLLARGGGGRGAAVPVFSERIDFGQGDAQPTGSDDHLALAGAGFFKVLGRDGTPRYTRAGEVRRDGEGRLATPDGLPFLGENDQPLLLEGDPAGFRVDRKGRVTDPSGQARGQLQLVSFADPSRLVPEGGGLFRAPRGVEAAADLESEVHQGSLERSNTDAVRELVSMITVQRSFQAAAKALAGIQGAEESLINSVR